MLHPTWFLSRGGTFEMGSENGDPDEKPVHRITLSSFFIDKYEVSVAKYRQFCTSTGRSMPGAPRWGWQENNPIVNVTSDDAFAYAQWAKKRLPTEAEWEYAARGGRSSHGYTYSGGKDIGSVAWYSDNSGDKPHTIGGKTPNELGLFDMSGNVWEWCSDFYDGNYYQNSPQYDPKGPPFGQYRVLRGGSLDSDDDDCRVTNRFSYFLTFRDFLYLYGFRCVQEAK